MKISIQKGNLEFFQSLGPLGGHREEAQRPRMKPCAWQTHGLCDTRLAEEVQCVHRNNTKKFSEGPFRREYHQSCAQPGFRAEKEKGAISGRFRLFSCVLGKKDGEKKTCAQPWYARKSGNSPAPSVAYPERRKLTN